MPNKRTHLTAEECISKVISKVHFSSSDIQTGQNQRTYYQRVFMRLFFHQLDRFLSVRIVQLGLYITKIDKKEKN